MEYKVPRVIKLNTVIAKITLGTLIINNIQQ